MEPEELKLRQAILRDRDDDTVRLAYADYLAENAPTEACWQCSGTGGKEWFDATHGAVDGPCGTCAGSGRLSSAADYADFIRKSCELSRLPEPEYKTIGRMVITNNGASIRVADDDPPFYCGGMCAKCYRLEDGERCPYHALWSQGRGLMHKGEQAQQWFAVPGLGVQLDFTMDRLNWWVQPSGGVITAELERGFVRKVACTAADWLRFADALTERQPIADVELTTFPHILNLGTDRNDDDIWFVDYPHKKLRADDVAAEVRTVKGSRDWIAAMYRLLWRGIKITDPRSD